MRKIKIMTVVGTRPEIIRLACVIKALENSEAVEHIIVHTGQNYDYELNEIFFKDFDIRRPDYFLDGSMKNATQTIGNIFIKIDPVLDDVKPDAFLVLGDTNSCLCTIPAKKRQIPIFHMEAGNRCFDQRVPEEINRKIVDHVSDINMVYSDIAREYLINEGLKASCIIKTGSPIYEVVQSKMSDIIKSDILNQLNLTKDKYFVVSAHREENIGNDINFGNLIDSLNEIAKVYNMPIVVSTHPRTRKKIEENNIKFDPLIKLMTPMGYCDYNKLQLDSFVVLSDSGTISEESSIMKFRALNIRYSHERPEAMEEGSVMMVGLEKVRIIQALKILETQEKVTLREVSDYSMPNVSAKVLRIILSYTDYINRTVWNK